MDQVNESLALVISGTPILVGFSPVSANTNHALDHSEEFFAWCTKYPSGPIRPILDPATHPVDQQWRELVIAQSMDMFADSGMNGINWTASMVEALGQVSHLSEPITQHVKLDGFDLVLHRVPDTQESVNSPSDDSQKDMVRDLPKDITLPKFISLTMVDVSRVLVSASSQMDAIADLVDRLNPSATRTEQSMLASALLTLSAIGHMTGYANALVGGPADPWHAHLAWDLANESPVLSGDVIDMQVEQPD